MEAGFLRNPIFSLLLPVGPKQLEFTLNWPLEALWQRPRRVAAARLDVERVAQGLVQGGLDVVRDAKLAQRVTPRGAFVAPKPVPGNAGEHMMDSAKIENRRKGITGATTRRSLNARWKGKARSRRDNPCPVWMEWSASNTGSTREPRRGGSWGS